MALTAPVWLLIGAVVSAAVAWGAVLWTGVTSEARGHADCTPAGDGTSWKYETDNPALLPEIVALAPPGPLPEPSWKHHTINGSFWRGAGWSARFTWVKDDGAPPAYLKIPHVVWVYRCGWPLAAFDCRAEPTVQELSGGKYITTSWRGGVQAPGWARPSLPAGRFLVPYRPIPMRPLWPGLLLDSVLSGAAAWLLWTSPFALRRVVRKRRGKCTACGYDLAGLAGQVCPECGREKPQPGAVVR